MLSPTRQPWKLTYNVGNSIFHCLFSFEKYDKQLQIQQSENHAIENYEKWAHKSSLKLWEWKSSWNLEWHGITWNMENTKNFHFSGFCSQSRNTDRHTEIVIVKSAWCWVSNEFRIWKFHPLLIGKHKNEMKKNG